MRGLEYTSQLQARLQAMCGDLRLAMPRLMNTDGPASVTAHVIPCWPEPDPCPAAHRIRAWQLAEIWRGIMAAGLPIGRQIEIAQYRLELEG